MSNGKRSCAQCSRRVNLWHPDPVSSPESPIHKSGLHAAPEFTGGRYKQAFTRLLFYVVHGLVAGLIFGFSNAYALDSTLQNGLNWLQGQVQADGSITTEADSVATRFQARTEAAYALRDLDVVPPSLAEAIQADSENNNEYVSRRLLVSTSTVSAPDVLNELTSRQNPDGGFGGMPLYQSNSLDTAYALMAAKTLAGKGYNVTQIVSQGLAYLASVQATEGSWALDSQGNTFVTAVVLSTVQEWYSVYSVGAMTTKAKDWLLAGRTNGTYPQVMDTAAVLYALSGQTTATDILGPLSDYLRSTQMADGSWNGDPYITALALRALWASSKPAQPVSTTGEITGRVMDVTNGSAISQAAIQLLENTSFSSASGGDGRFTLSGVTPGTYTLRVSVLGYEPRQLVVTVAAGETVFINDIALKVQALTASISGLVKASNGVAIADVTVSVGTVSTMTNGMGAYSLTGLSPGAATITATKSGYQTASASITFTAGVSYTFSPTLYTSYAPTPTTATLRGKLTDASTGTALSGGTVTLGGVNKITAADGSFEYTNLGAGAFSLTASASGYQNITASGSLSVGVNDLGKLPLQRLLSDSTLSGKVMDAESGVPLANAQINIQGTTQSAVTTVDGAYSIANVTGTALIVNVGATGYQSTSFNLVLTSPGNITADFPLLKLQPGGIVISEITPSKGYYAPYDEFDVTIKIANSNAESTDLVVEAQVLDALNSLSFEMPANAKGLGLNPPNLPLTITAASSHVIELSHFMIRESGGQHTVLVRAHDTSGRVVAEGTATFIVRDEALVAGGLEITPPLAQAGSNIPVNFTAQLGNFGNLPIESTTADLVVTLENPDVNVSTQPKTTVTQITNNTLINPSRSLARDKAGNLYTVNSGYNDGRVLRIEPTGDASVFATVPKTTGAPSLRDVLVDALDNVWAADANGRVWKITQTGVISEIRISLLSGLTGFDLNAAGDIYASGTSANKQVLVKRDAAGVETLLWSNGLSTPVGIVSDGAGGYVVSNSGDGTLVKVGANGSVSAFASGLSAPKGIVRDGSGNYFVVSSGNGSVVKVAPDGSLSVLASGLPQPVDIAMSGSDLYVTTWGDGAVYRISSAGVSELYVRGLANRPQGMTYDGSGNLFVTGDDGLLRKKDAAGQVSVVETGISSPRGLATTSTGDVLVASYGAGSVVKVTAMGKTNFATGLSGPYGVAVSPSDEVWVTEQGQNRLARFGADGSLLERIESVLVSPDDLAAAPDGRVWVSNTNFVTQVESDSPSIWSRGRDYRKIAYDPSSGGLAALAGFYDVYRIDGSGTAVKVKTLPNYSYGIAVDPSGNIIVTSGATIQKLDSLGALTTLVSLPTTVQSLSGDSLGRHFVVAGSKLYRIETDYTVTSLPVPNSEYAYWAKAGADGQLLVWTGYYGSLYRVDPDTAAFVKVNGAYVNAAISDVSGGINATVSSRHELSRYDSTGLLQGSITGFSAPRDAEWYVDGIRFTDSSGRLFHAKSGQAPVLLGGSLNAAYLAVRGADLFATSGPNVYKWNGAGWTAVKSVLNLYSLTGIAIRQDGAITVGDNSYSRLVTFDGSSYAILEHHGGLTTPWGITVAPDGKIYVADYGSSTVSRLEGMGQPPTFQARIFAPRYLAVESAGTILVSHAYGISRLNPATGLVTTVPGVTGQPEKMLVDGSRILSVDSQGRVFKFENNAWSLLASGINSTRALGLLADRVYVLNGNGALSVYQSGNLDMLAYTGIAQPRSLTRNSQGWLVGGDGGALVMVDQAGVVNPIHIALLIGNKPVYGLHELSAEANAMLSGDGHGYTLSRLTTTSPQEPPAAGTVVYSASLPIGALPTGDNLLSLDYGSWVPPYGGGFRAEVTVPGVIGAALNYLYVGPHAQGLLSTTSDEQMPGNQTVPFNLNVTGADFVSLSRVETGQIRPLTSISRPYGMVGDKSGNLWYTDFAHLYRKSAAGVNDTIVSGLALAYGLAVDSQERFYLASRNASTSRYNLLRVGTDGAVQTIADLGVAQVNGVAVNSRDEIFIGAPNNLIKVDPVTGAVSTFTTLGLPQPRNIAIDGKDNVYVQNESDVISMIKPDRSSVLLFSKGDGVIDPSFEGDGYPNIAADCADNFYIAPAVWKVINQNSEEHTLAQVVPRTGQVSALFDGLKISSHLGDIDYLSFDRFGSRILMWADYVNEIWQVPVTCGAISVEAHLVAQPGQTLAGFSQPPSATVPLVDGRTEYVFSLRDVSVQGASIGGVTELSGLMLGEDRPVMESAHLLFQNSFIPQQVQLPVDVPNVHVRNLVDLAVSTDQPEYPAGGTALISGAISNTNTRLVSGDLRVVVEDASGVVVGPVIVQPAVMAAGESLLFNEAYAIGAIVPGNYAAVARLYENDAVVAVAQAGFKVLANQGEATAYSSLSLDRQSYAPSDQLLISSRATNRSLNVILENLRLAVRVLDPSGTELFKKEYPILQLTSGMSQDFSTAYPYLNAAPGTYQVEQTLLDSDGRVFDRHVVDYVVQSSSDTGFGLTGTIRFTAPEYAVGESVLVTFGVNNTGNALITGLPLKLAIVSPETQQVLAEFAYTADIGAEDAYFNSATWIASGSGGESYAAVLQAELGGKVIVLAQAVFKIKKEVVKLDLTHSLSNGARLLVLAGCGKDAVLDANGLQECTQERAAMIDSMLTALPLPHFVTPDPAIFLRELRSGVYNTYWVSGKVGKMHDYLDEELREAAFRGDTLLVDGAHDERNKMLDDTIGVKINGKLGTQGLPVSLIEPFEPVTLPSEGRGLKLSLTTGQAVGYFGPAPDSPVAVAANSYGYGHGLQYGHDLLGGMQLDTSGWRNAFSQGLAWAAAPLTDNQVAGEVIEYQLTLANLGVATSGELRLALPDGAVYLSASTAPITAPTSASPQGIWSFDLPEEGTHTLRILVRLPELSGSHAFVSEAGAIVNGAYQRSGEPLTSTISVVSVLRNLDPIRLEIQSLPITLANERVLRDKAIAKLDAADQAVANQDYATAIELLAIVADALDGITADSVREARYSVDRALKEAEWQWHKTQ